MRAQAGTNPESAGCSLPDFQTRIIFGQHCYVRVLRVPFTKEVTQVKLLIFVTELKSCEIRSALEIVLPLLGGQFAEIMHCTEAADSAASNLDSR